MPIYMKAIFWQKQFTIYSHATVAIVRTIVFAFTSPITSHLTAFIDAYKCMYNWRLSLHDKIISYHSVLTFHSKANPCTHSPHLSFADQLKGDSSEET